MEKVINPYITIVMSFGLSDFIIMMREFQIDAAGVDIKVWT
jgi:hypothetical protein